MIIVFLAHHAAGAHPAWAPVTWKEQVLGKCASFLDQWMTFRMQRFSEPLQKQMGTGAISYTSYGFGLVSTLTAGVVLSFLVSTWTVGALSVFRVSTQTTPRLPLPSTDSMVLVSFASPLPFGRTMSMVFCVTRGASPGAAGLRCSTCSSVCWLPSAALRPTLVTRWLSCSLPSPNPPGTSVE